MWLLLSRSADGGAIRSMQSLSALRSEMQRPCKLLPNADSAGGFWIVGNLGSLNTAPDDAGIGPV
ncbi:hypothetical protein [Methylophilus aquaticus]|uniref:Uncharacterized protein n=1 Tax=Methylophilus aquaticus TaxID=1971610 RepID=A0ABT9JWF3_9PROT|nr:hypothetical protein [Methylophilus aquaticus]MDP8568921.1 hypothetical protein [Methylophilus aquaticus]